MKRKLLLVILLWLTCSTRVMTGSWNGHALYNSEEQEAEENDESTEPGWQFDNWGGAVPYLPDEAHEENEREEDHTLNWIGIDHHLPEQAEEKQVWQNEQSPNCQCEDNIANERPRQYNHPAYRTRHGIHYVSYYKCTCNNVVFTTGRPLNIFQQQSNSVKSLTFIGSSFSLIPVGVFGAFTNLSELHLNNNLINSIHPGAFTGLTKLTKLYLQNNNITKITKGILNSLPDLNILNLSNNSIAVIEENALLGLFALQKIYLHNNKLKVLWPDTFHELHNLNVIDLSYNFLSDMPINLFSDLSFYTDFSFFLSNNNFTSINFEVFPNSLEYLILRNNHISAVKNWSHFRHIKILDLSDNGLRNIEVLYESLLNFNLSGNGIEEINSSVFNKSINLDTLDLSRNLLKNINENTFMSLHRLRNLYLQNNQLIHIPIGCFRDLQSLCLLNLSSNGIEEFEYGTFSGLSALAIFDISGNKLAYLYESSFYDLKNLEVLNISDNLITSFDPHDLTDHSKHLQTVDLNNNPWFCKSLLNIFRTLERSNVTVTEGSTQKTTNVRGVACANYNFKEKNATFNSHFEHKTENASLAKSYAISNEISTLKKFLDEDFLNSSFYKYFETFKQLNFTPNVNVTMNSAFLQYFNDGFKNTTFYNYFEKDFSNISFFNRLDEAFRKSSKSLTALDDNFKNSSLYRFVNSEAMGQNLSKYFDNGLKNSSFYKYFNKEFSNSEFFKYFDKTFETRIDSNLIKIRNYFDNDFKNSTFYAFFNEDYINRLNSNFIKHSKRDPEFSSLTGSSSSQIHEDDFLTKISELTDTVKAQQKAMQTARTGSAIFMTIIVIILLAITFLLAYNRVRTGLNRHICNCTSENTQSRIHINEAEMELM